MDKQQIAKLIKDIEDKHGKGSIFTLGSKYEGGAIERISTGLEDLDAAIGGGLPKGRIIELFGIFSAGKTSLAYHLMSKVSHSLFIDMEGTFNSELAKTYGVKKALIRRPDWGEQAMELLFNFTEAGIPLIVVDSIPAMIPRKEFEGKNMEKQEGVAMVAGLLSRKLPKLVNLAEKSGTVILFINQIRDKIGALLFGDKYNTPGGHALKHFASLRIQIARKEWLVTKDIKFGQISKVRIIKSKVCAPHKEAELPLIFNKGFISHEEIKQAAKEFRETL